MLEALKKIVIIEDEKEAAVLFEEMLKVKGFRTINLAPGKDHTHIILEDKPDAIIIDITAPFIAGMETLRILRSIPEINTIPILVLSEMSLPADIKSVMDAGATDYLTKPVGFERLINSLNKHLLP